MGNGGAVASISMGTKVIRKLRIRILPFVFVLFIVALIDRNNFRFAPLTMNKELAITSQQFGLISGIFFFGYFIFEIPSNLLLLRFSLSSESRLIAISSPTRVSRMFSSILTCRVPPFLPTIAA
jgi:hypothetical protein